MFVLVDQIHIGMFGGPKLVIEYSVISVDTLRELIEEERTMSSFACAVKDEALLAKLERLLGMKLETADVDVEISIWNGDSLIVVDGDLKLYLIGEEWGSWIRRKWASQSL